MTKVHRKNVRIRKNLRVDKSVGIGPVRNEDLGQPGELRLATDGVHTVHRLSAEEFLVDLAGQVSVKATADGNGTVIPGALYLYADDMKAFALRTDDRYVRLNMGIPTQDGDGSLPADVSLNGKKGATIHLSGANAAVSVGGTEKAGRMELRNTDGVNAIDLKALDGTATAREFLTVGGCCAQMMPVADGARVPEPGSVVVSDGTGVLAGDQEYDPRVVGVVVEQEGDSRPGLRLAVGEGEWVAVAILGQALCQVTAPDGCEVGFLLTTSSTEGHAQVAAHGLNAFGAILGKAMASLDAGETALIPVQLMLG